MTLDRAVCKGYSQEVISWGAYKCTVLQSTYCGDIPQIVLIYKERRLRGVVTSFCQKKTSQDVHGADFSPLGDTKVTWKSGHLVNFQEIA